MVSLTFVFQFPWCSHSEWTIERHHLEAEYGESLETIDDDLVVLLERIDGLFAAVVTWTVYVFVRVPLTGTCHCVPPSYVELLRCRARGCSLFGVPPNASKPHALRWSRDGRVRH
jgi:hypothetical protein